MFRMRGAKTAHPMYLPRVVFGKVLEGLHNMIKHDNLHVSLLHVRWLKILQQVFRTDVLTNNNDSCSIWLMWALKLSPSATLHSNADSQFKIETSTIYVPWNFFAYHKAVVLVQPWILHLELKYFLAFSSTQTHWIGRQKLVCKDRMYKLMMKC